MNRTKQLIIQCHEIPKPHHYYKDCNTNPKSIKLLMRKANKIENNQLNCTTVHSFDPKKRLLLITLSENSGRLSWGCSLKYFDKSLLSSYIQKNCEISWWSKLQSQRTLYTQTKLHFFFWSTYALTLDSSTLIGRFNKYCPWCATSISSSVTILKLLFSITCIAMKGR